MVVNYNCQGVGGCPHNSPAGDDASGHIKNGHFHKVIHFPGSFKEQFNPHATFDLKKFKTTIVERISNRSLKIV